MPASAYLQKAMLDWVLGGATPTQPPAFWAALATATPGSRSDQASEMAIISGYTRVSCSMGPASTQSSASCSNNTSMTFGPFSSPGSAVGVTLWDSQTIGSTNMLWYNTFLTNRTFDVGESLVILPGALVLTMS